MLISRNLHNKRSEVSIVTRSPPASLSLKGQVTRHTTVKRSIFQLVTYFMCGTYFSSSVWELNNQNYEIFAVFHRCPWLQLRQDKIMALKLSTLLYSIHPMSGGWKLHFSSRPFCLTSRRTYCSLASQCYLCRPVVENK